MQGQSQRQPVFQSLVDQEKRGTMAGQAELSLEGERRAPIGAVSNSAEQRESEAAVPGQHNSAHARANESLGFCGTATRNSVLPSTKPKNFIPFSIVTCLFCNPIFGLVALYYSIMSDKMYTRGDITTATKYGQRALGVSMFGMVLTGVIVGIVLLTGTVVYRRI